MNIHSIFKESVQDSIDLRNSILNDEACADFVQTACTLIIDRFKQNGKLLIVGNGGSAADAQHFAAEFTGRFKRERVPLPAIALTTDTSALTAIGNDYSFDDVFSRQTKALCTTDDIVFAISTSGMSQNIVNALVKAKEKGAVTIGLYGKNGGKCKDITDVSYTVLSCDSARIQEIHIMLEHIICDIVELYFSENG